MSRRVWFPVLLILLLLGAGRGLCLSEGETLQQVIAEKGDPASQMAVGTRRILNYPDAVVKLDNDVVVSFSAVDKPTPTPEPTVAAAPDPNRGHPTDAGPVPTSLAEARTKLSAALSRARAIINQPLESFPETAQRRARTRVYSPGWYDPGAEIPHFIDAHIESTQKRDDGQYEWCTSDLNPGVVFRSADKEFNPQTKFFYMDPTVPKKRLTAEEMAQLDVIYHQIGLYAAYLQRAGHPWTPTPGE